MSPFSVVATVRIENGFALCFDMWDDGPYPKEWRLNDFRVSEQRVPRQHKEELEKLAWIEWRARGHGHYYEEDFDDECS